MLSLSIIDTQWIVITPWQIQTNPVCRERAASSRAGGDRKLCTVFRSLNCCKSEALLDFSETFADRGPTDFIAFIKWYGFRREEEISNCNLSNPPRCGFPNAFGMSSTMISFTALFQEEWQIVVQCMGYRLNQQNLICGHTELSLPFWKQSRCMGWWRVTDDQCTKNMDQILDEAKTGRRHHWMRSVRQMFCTENVVCSRLDGHHGDERRFYGSASKENGCRDCIRYRCAEWSICCHWTNDESDDICVSTVIVYSDSLNEFSCIF